MSTLIGNSDRTLACQITENAGGRSTWTPLGKATWVVEATTRLIKLRPGRYRLEKTTGVTNGQWIDLVPWTTRGDPFAETVFITNDSGANIYVNGTGWVFITPLV